MAKQTIGIGSSANDGTGDPLRDAFDKVNDNFTELYDVAPSDTAYAASWDGVTTIPPSKNAVYDKFEVDAGLRHPGYIAGRWYVPDTSGSPSGGSVMAANRIYYHLVRIPRTITISDLGVRITTTNAGNVKLAIYANDTTTNRPSGTPLAETASITAASVGNVSADITGANVTLQAGLYWMAVWQDNAVSAVQCLGAQASIFDTVKMVGSTSQGDISDASARANFVITSDETYGTWPNATSETFSIAAGSNWAVLMQLKAA